MIAVPDFAAGAMENWGLMIYREATMLWDPLYGTAITQQKVATVISHEIAHQVRNFFTFSYFYILLILITINKKILNLIK